MSGSAASSATPSSESSPPQPRSNWLALLATLVASVIAILLATLPAMISNGGPVRYDAPTAIYTITFIGIAFYTYSQWCTLSAQRDALETSNWQNDYDRRRSDQASKEARHVRGASIATAALAELPQIVTRLHILSETRPWSYHGPLSHPLLTESLRHVELFDAETVHALASVEGRLGEIAELVANYRHEREVWLEAGALLRDKQRLSMNPNEPKTAQEEKDRHGENLQQMELLIAAYAADAHNQIPSLVDALCRAGGVKRPRSDRGDKKPPLLPDPFADA